MNAVIQTDRQRCYYCDIPIAGNPRPGIANKATKDHIIPKSKGGGSHEDNIVLCCGDCNLKKGSKTLTLYYRETLHPYKKEQIAKLLGYVYEQGDRLYASYQPPIKPAISIPAPDPSIHKPSKVYFNRGGVLYELKPLNRKKRQIVVHCKKATVLDEGVKSNIHTEPSDNFHEDFVYHGIVY